MIMKKCFSYLSCYDNHRQQQKKEDDRDDANERSPTSDEQKKNIGYSSISTMFKCDLCHRIFTSGTALGGHKSHHHRSDHHLQPLTKKQRHDGVDDHRKQKHECLDYDKVFPSNMRSHREKGSSKGIESPTTSFPVSFLEQQSDMCDLDQFQVDGAPPAIDLSKYLPPRSHQTKKRTISERNMIDDELMNAAHILLDMSRGRDDDDHTPKRLKLSSNATDNETLQKQDSSDNDETPGTKMKGINKNNIEKSLVLRFKIQPSSFNVTGETPDTKVKVPYNNTKKSLVLRFKIPHSLPTDNKIFQTSEGCSQHGSIVDIQEMKKNNEGETGREQSHNELKSERVVRNFDLNELPPNGVTDE